MEKKFKRAINKLCLFYPNTFQLKEFKEELLSTLLDKYQEMISSGKNADVAYRECIKSLDDYKETLIELNNSVEILEKKSYIKQTVTFSITYVLFVTLLYFILSFTVGWTYTWLTFVVGAIIAGIIILSILVNISRKKSNYVLTRCCIPLITLIVTSILYLIISFTVPNIWNVSWTAFLVAIFIAHSADMIYRRINNKPLIPVFDILVSTLSIALIAYFLISFLMNAWSSTWIIFISWLFIYFFALFIVRLISNRKPK